MEEESNNRRLLIAAGLCLLVLVGWQFIFPAPPKAPRPAAKADGGEVATSTSSAGQPTIAQTSTSGAQIAEETNVKPETMTFEGDVPSGEGDALIPYRVRLTNVGGAIESFELPSYKERDRDNRKTEQPITLAKPTTPAQGAYPQMASIQFLEGTTFAVPEVPTYAVSSTTSDSITYRYVTKSGVVIEREYHLKKDDFQIEMAVTIRNGSSSPQSHRLSVGSAIEVTDVMLAGSGFFATFFPPPDHLEGICHTGDTVERFPAIALQQDGKQSFKESVRWAAMDRQYFNAAIVPRDGTEVECVLSYKSKVARADLELPAVALQPGEVRRHKFTAFLGVKKPAFLTRANANLEQAINYTVMWMNLAVLCKVLLWVLGLLHSWFNSWGVAILGLTILVKLVLFPLNQRSGKSMRKTTALKPQMDAIREKFAEDRQRQSEEMMKLYREHGVNPVGGCLPVLLQMPIWLALYKSLSVATDLYQQKFLWIQDLTARDPYYILPVLLIVTMFIQQKMTPTSMDPMQQKIMTYTMPLVFGLMMMALPAGLCFYILVNTLLTILQTHFINRSVGPIGGSASVPGVRAENPTGR